MSRELPSELRPLVTFLEADQRPTAIFKKCFGETTTWERAYANKSFLLQDDVATQEAADFVQQTLCTHRAEGQYDQQHLNWMPSDVCEGFVAVVARTSTGSIDLSRKLEDALETKRQSENFIDMTSHELRNPLSSIFVSADSIISSLQPAGPMSMGNELTLASTVVEEMKDAANSILLCANFQKKIVDDILTLSKLDANLLELAPDKVQIPRIIDKALLMFDTEITQARIQTKLVIEPTYEALAVDWVVLDPDRLLQVVINLLTNAIKFAQSSDVRQITIYIGASYERPTGKHHGINFVPLHHNRSHSTLSSDWGTGEDLYLQVAVTDTGSSLDDEQIQALFKRFAQASPKTHKQYGGNGLGLFISRELCELHGGQIGVSSSPDKTTFTFYIKAKRWVETDEEQPTRLTQLVSASSSPIALRTKGTSILVHDTDQVLPGKERTRPDGTAEACSLSTTQGSFDNNAEQFEHLHVLLVEDNLINQRITAQQLRKAGLTVHVANHGLECLNFISQSSYSSAPTTPQIEAPEDFLPTTLSIVLLDIEMPVMDGLTCIRHIREQQSQGEIKGHVPVIAVTANARSEQINSAITAGMDEVVTKPFRMPDLVARMRKLVSEVLARD